jgi:hypothetical protein
MWISCTTFKHDTTHSRGLFNTVFQIKICTRTVRFLPRLGIFCPLFLSLFVYVCFTRSVLVDHCGLVAQIIDHYICNLLAQTKQKSVNCLLKLYKPKVSNCVCPRYSDLCPKIIARFESISNKGKMYCVGELGTLSQQIMLPCYCQEIMPF